MIFPLCKWIAIACCSFMLLRTACFAQTCPYSSQSASDILAFLDSRSPLEENACIDTGLRALQNLSIPRDGIPVLIRYLSHKRLLTSSEKMGFLMHGGSDFYPAVDALFVAGANASDPLVGVLDSTDDQLTRKNALDAYRGIHRDNLPKGITILMEHARASQGNPQAKRLSSAAKSLADSCIPNIRKECLQALR